MCYVAKRKVPLLPYKNIKVASQMHEGKVEVDSQDGAEAEKGSQDPEGSKSRDQAKGGNQPPQEVLCRGVGAVSSRSCAV